MVSTHALRVTPNGAEDQVGRAIVLAARRERNDRRITWTSWLALSAIFLLLWQIASERWVDPFWISSPTRVLVRLALWVTTGELWPHLLTTVLEATTGFCVGAALSLVFGLVLAVLPRIYKILSPFLNALYSLPKITLGPLLILYFGIGFEMKFVLSAIITFFLVFLTRSKPVRYIDPELIAVVRVAGASKWQLTRSTLLPAALGGIRLACAWLCPTRFRAQSLARSSHRMLASATSFRSQRGHSM